jgi:hypothetical protein
MQSFSNPCTMALASGDSTYVSWTQNIIRLMSSFMPLVPPPQLSMAWLSVPSFTMTFLSMARMLVSKEIPEVSAAAAVDSCPELLDLLQVFALLWLMQQQTSALLILDVEPEVALGDSVQEMHLCCFFSLLMEFSSSYIELLLRESTVADKPLQFLACCNAALAIQGGIAIMSTLMGWDSCRSHAPAIKSSSTSAASVLEERMLIFSLKPEGGSGSDAAAAAAVP